VITRLLGMSFTRVPNPSAQPVRYSTRYPRRLCCRVAPRRRTAASREGMLVEMMR
jgi:hypothetical protein